MPIFGQADASCEFRQAEILSGLAEYTFDPETQEVEVTKHAYCVVLSQDCDLLRDFEDRQAAKPSPLNGVLIFLARPATDLKDLVNGGIRKRIIQNDDQRYHVIEAVPATADAVGEGIPALVIDFRRFFTMSSKVLYYQCGLEAETKRRSVLSMPYKEHLQSRLAFYLARVALPNPHSVII
ncbi:hypothetical protein OVY48_07975 [Sphingobium sp. SA2]|uniref:hypothetical protein n=1 Tax=Sphingobium sp. SA2 TaxID=1524832 RepID=UPI0028C35237|nr:hypothetical protein [Sphingobium sp. SA2]MDT7533365.1 hypothetical protein [Sphingobium sp. SA2]